ncbi:MAG: Ca2+/Na+ antiporter [Marinoscillum sp.]|jgi:Ca2+/Na+ antiporter
MINLLTLITAMLLQIPMADSFRADGKIYVVLGIILILLFGFFAYLIRIDRKIKRIETEINANKS